MRQVEKVVVWLTAMGVLVAAIYFSHRWDEKSGIDPIYVILLLVVGSLAFRAPRKLLIDVLSRVSKFSFGGVEVTLQVADAVAAAAALPFADEDEDAGERKLTIVGDSWRKDPAEAMARLQRRLEKRLRWIEGEIYATRIPSNAKTIERLRAGGLIHPFERRIAEAVLEIAPTDLGRDIDRGRDTKEAAIRFVERADKVVQQFRLIPFDKRLRLELEARGLRIIDIGGQHEKRWPDFYALDREDHTGARQPFRIAVRMALNKNSKLIERTRKRFLNGNKWPETPFDDMAQPVIVYPQTSKTEPADCKKVPAYKYEGFLAQIDEYMTTNLTPAQGG